MHCLHANNYLISFITLFSYDLPSENEDLDQFVPILDILFGHMIPLVP